MYCEKAYSFLSSRVFLTEADIKDEAGYVYSFP